MLEALFGNKNIERILLFIFVHGSCYGAKLQKVFKVPLTPLQKALLRLERGGIITSYYAGKTRLYEFNPAYPLLEELELLLKKCYTHLLPQEKKHYTFIQKDAQERIVGATLLHEVWKRLASVKKLTFQAKSKKQPKNHLGWDGKGKADVVVGKESPQVLIFTEKGERTIKNSPERMGFSNSLRWTLDEKRQMISLEHLRRGHEHPVFLFHFVATGTQELTSQDAHLCDGDSYFGALSCSAQFVRLSIRIIGAKKNETIDYYYT